MAELTTVTAVGLLVTMLVVAQNLVRYVRVGDWNGIGGILLAAAGGVGVAFAAANADVTASLQLVDGAPPLGDLDAGSLVLVGLAFGTGGSFAVDTLNALDSSSSQRKPRLVERTQE